MDKTHQITSLIAKIRQSAARWISVISLVSLALSLLLFIWMWSRAYMHGNIPHTSWGQYEGNHGPWRHNYDLRGVWWQILNLQLCALILGLVSFVFKPNRRVAIIAGLAFVSGCLFFATHYWLVD
ncbi:MAG: hypothetical protein NTU54_08860 [Candidatus Omnitrophica bacterium]|nr:hypothetical protein [Candidatus Omnitrophota bacterium]